MTRRSLAEIVEELRGDEAAQPEPAPAHRLLFFDIETAPLLSFHWQAKTEYIGPHMLERDKFMLSWSAKWSDQKQVKSAVLSSKEALEQDDARIVQSLADLMREADHVVAHNAKRFDIPMVNARLLNLGLEPLGPIKPIDTLTLARKTFRLTYNKLDYLAEVLGLEGKIDTDFGLWRRCYFGDDKALQDMARYNRQDVRLLEQVYEAMVPYVNGLPRTVDATHADQMACPTCGKADLVQDGVHRTNASTFPRWRCDSCGRHCRSRTADTSAKLSVVPL